MFVAYFPHLVAGPILRASALLPQIAQPRRITREQVVEGLWLMGYGFFKKVYVADNLAYVTDGVFNPAHPSGFQILLALYAFAFQIYGDFSGYSDMARGMSKLMGIELNVNFRFPYFVRTPQEFWQHWHISLSTWLRDYLFLPMSYALSRRIDEVRWLGLRRRLLDLRDRDDGHDAARRTVARGRVDVRPVGRLPGADPGGVHGRDAAAAEGEARAGGRRPAPVRPSARRRSRRRRDVPPDLLRAG